MIYARSLSKQSIILSVFKQGFCGGKKKNYFLIRRGRVDFKTVFFFCNIQIKLSGIKYFAVSNISYEAFVSSRPNLNKITAAP